MMVLPPHQATARAINVEAAYLRYGGHDTPILCGNCDPAGSALRDPIHPCPYTIPDSVIVQVRYTSVPLQYGLKVGGNWVRGPFTLNDFYGLTFLEIDTGGMSLPVGEDKVSFVATDLAGGGTMCDITMLSVGIPTPGVPDVGKLVDQVIAIIVGATPRGPTQAVRIPDVLLPGALVPGAPLGARCFQGWGCLPTTPEDLSGDGPCPFSQAGNVCYNGPGCPRNIPNFVICCRPDNPLCLPGL